MFEKFGFSLSPSETLRGIKNSKALFILFLAIQQSAFAYACCWITSSASC